MIKFEIKFKIDKKTKLLQSFKNCCKSSLSKKKFNIYKVSGDGDNVQ